MSITLSDAGTTSTTAVTVGSPAGINALGVRMVYQSTDLAAASGTSTAAPTGPTSTGPAGSDNDSGSGLSTGVIIAIAVIIPVVAIAVAAGLFLFIRRRKQAQKAGEGAAGMPHDYSKTGYSAVAAGSGGFYDAKSPAPPSEVSGVGAYGVRNQQQELVELGQHQVPVELPAEHRR